MPRLYVLSDACSFDEVARHLDDSELALELRDVVSSTFPSRPEPKRATWTLPTGEPLLRYHLVAHVGLRSLCELSTTTTYDRPHYIALRERLQWLRIDSWDLITQDLTEGDYPKLMRAAEALTAAARIEDPSIAAESLLMRTAERARGHRQRAASEALSRVASGDQEARIESLLQETDDAVVHLHLFQALERIRAQR